jgi:ABC-type lipoprotein release transport system permease subunit
MSGRAVVFAEQRLFSRRRGAMTLLIIVIAVACGAITATAAGARRSSSAWNRLLHWSKPPDLVTGGLHDVDDSATADKVLTRAEHLPIVTAFVRQMIIGDGIRTPDGHAYITTVHTVATDMSDPAFGKTKVLHGRLPSNDRADEAVTDFVSADLLGVHVGDSVDVLFGVPGEEGSTTDPVRIVGIIAAPTVFPSLNGRADKTVLLTPAFMQKHADRIDWTNGMSSIHVRGSNQAAVDQYRVDLDAAGLVIDDIRSIHQQGIGTQHVFAVEARGLWLVVAILGAATLMILLQLMRRDASLRSTELRFLHELGMTRRNLAAIGALRGLLVGAIGAAIGVIVAVLVSPAFPIGLSRIADPDIGIHADWLVLSIGAVAAVGAAVVTSTAGVFVVARKPSMALRRASRVASIGSRLGPVGATGTRLAFGSPGRPTDRTRAGVALSAITLTLLVWSLCLESSFDHLLASPRLVGATWDIALAYDNPADRPPALAKLANEPDVEAATPGSWGGLIINGEPMYGMTMDTERGVDVAVDRGRAPRGSAEMAIGSAEMAERHISTGDRVEVALQQQDGTPGKSIEATVTGRAVLASPLYFSLPLGRGGVIPLTLYERLGGSTDDLANILVKLKDGIPLQRGYDEVVSHMNPNFSFTRPENIGITSLDQLKRAIQALLLILAALCATSFVYALLVKTRRNRHDMATLRSIGMTIRQLTMAHVVHGVLAAAVAAVVAVPVAIVAAAFTWRQLAEFMGAVARPVTSVPATAGVAVAAIVIGATAARVVGWREARRSPTELLRTE